MNRFFKVRLITAIMFLIILFAFSIFNICYSGKDTIQEIKNSIAEKSSLKDTISSIDNTVNDKVIYKNTFIETYGYLQKLMGKNEFSKFSVVKDTSGKMHYTYFAKAPNPVGVIADRVRKFSEEMEKQNTKLVYLMTPDKYIKGVTKFPKGIPYSYSNETADNFLNQLKKYNVDYIDFRENILKSGIPKDDLFFKTDHHWKVETSFWAFGELVEQLNKKYNMNLDENHYYRDKDNYNSIVYPKSFLGSMGRKTGILYGGIDDFTLIYPKFKTNYTYYTDSKSQKFELKGRFEESLILSYPFNADLDLMDGQSDKYFTYLLGNRPLVKIKNIENPDGLKVLFVKDSLIVPTAAFFSSVCSSIDMIDPRYYDGDILEYAKSHDYDFVFISVYPQNLTKEFFPFCE
ncbi:TPA: hypothetical protein ACKONR_002097 [Clostridioides difficile]|uniref:alginate O-acetyltransferase AlgX-related protein n=1 Tax=Clostridioides difficile TaxID=1496 RepID=UPI00038D0098|nr:hypothetical protein [Clostridioides difficile]AXU28554.1 hypothetical protein CDIF102859_02847 [Clostridioides difficile]AXU32350.1 hypothetical protein CDIF102860_02872 [Clostridioides difficile]AXU36138.1 hypothetical protein CDIF102978_02872 [Clostridioides difficile]EQE84094.1 hypothetical protein QCW_2657 [Clostridioides difficile CD69]KJF62582.1 membrane protein [Clostridioides difficile]